VGAQGRQIETEAAPIRYVAELLGSDTDSGRALSQKLGKRSHAERRSIIARSSRQSVTVPV
jgi:hypothetical protein